MHESGKNLVGLQVAGAYALREFLRPGRFGDFWVGAHEVDGTRVAVKLLRPSLFKDGEAIRRFQREARVLSDFRHPHVVQVIGHGQTSNGDPYLVTELLEGVLLSDEIAKGPMPVERVQRIGAQLARVLASAHTHGIVHRGLSPGVILLVPDKDGDWVKLQDFGLVHVDPSVGEPMLTEVGQRLGDPQYMAPEYVEHQIVDARTDLYLLGVLLFEMLTGHPPFDGRPMHVLTAQVETPPPAPSEHTDTDVPAWLDELVLKLLAKDPAARPEDAREAARALATGA